ncbi:MAG: ATP-dependent DNA/RNA helicase [Sclerophora amabilis]|nr:MAG: ATP-dependent DNA/RNA helicase [Sclerophora amabilis]
MKRKLDQDNVPVTSTEYDASKKISSQDDGSFVTFGLDPRILKGILSQEYSAPTTVQVKAIPLALQGRDVLARAKTGSGKTAAYLIPILHSVLKRKSKTNADRYTSALILVPTRELAEQVYKEIEQLVSFCAKDIRFVNLSRKVSEAVLRTLLSDSPDIVVATPSRAQSSASSSALKLDRLSHLVIDEADLLLSYGYDEDLQTISKSVPKGVQTFLMSATLTTEVDTLKGLFCRNPVILRLDNEDESREDVSQFVIRCGEEEKFLLVFVILKLKLIKGKFIIFVGDIDRCYRLRLYLEQFGIRSCVLNSELPVNSRLHVVEEYNKNVYDIIIATDENEMLRDEEDSHTRHDESDPSKTIISGADQAPDFDNSLSELQNGEKWNPSRLADEQSIDKGQVISAPSKKKPNRPKSGKEYGISRGIDFKNVACVLNFDLPTTSRSYTHRIGRTARAGKAGMALSFVVPKELYGKHKPTSVPTTKNDEAVIEKITKQQSKHGRAVKPYGFDMKQVAAFRYRVDDALKAVTRLAVREARTRELRQELLKSEKLKRHFEENPGDLHHLRHDGELRGARIHAHLKHVPDYLLPKNREQGLKSKDIGYVGMGKTSQNRIRNARMQNRARGRRASGKKADPLKSFRGKRTR